DTEAFGPLALEDVLQFRAVRRIQRYFDAAELKRRAGVEHVRERTLGDDEMLRWVTLFGYDDGEAAAKEVIWDFVDLRVSVCRQPGALARGNDRGIERVFDAGLEGGIEKGNATNIHRSPIAGLHGVAQNDGAFSKRAGLI